jgi:hypothetical protein
MICFNMTCYINEMDKIALVMAFLLSKKSHLLKLYFNFINVVLFGYDVQVTH